ncbi:gustatory receptor 5a for trehalose-like [Galleria mellonella]|uniref:Gustatory receptor 5a for trehalose-like n=1 Tax=Galleria mellonella TaxID=7137 RepID=A0ABM3MQM8_GALME|nr:gustatory receptor 5a for trehalose-like [Galleria mellonella]
MIFVEHICSLTYYINLAFRCEENIGTLSEVIEKCLRFLGSYFFNYLPYNNMLAIFIKIANVQATFLWSFTDVILVCFSIYLISYFQDLNKIIDNPAKQKYISWKRLRIYYSHAVSLVTKIDAQLGSMILVTYFIYIIFICRQLYNVLNRLHVHIKVHECDQHEADE